VRSRSLKSESAPKTSAAARVVRLTESNLEILKQMVDLNAKPNDYIFRNILGDPIDQRGFYKIFCRAQRALSIRLRNPYATKDTYVSLALTKGVNLTWLSEQTGVMESTLRPTTGGSFMGATRALWSWQRSTLPHEVTVAGKTPFSYTG